MKKAFLLLAVLVVSVLGGLGYMSYAKSSYHGVYIDTIIDTSDIPAGIIRYWFTLVSYERTESLLHKATGVGFCSVSPVHYQGSSLSMHMSQKVDERGIRIQVYTGATADGTIVKRYWIVEGADSELHARQAIDDPIFQAAMNNPSPYDSCA